MDSSLFLIHYIKSIWTPKRAFQNRKQLSWPQIFIIFLFLTFLMALPVYRYYSSIETFSIQDFFPNAVQLIDEEAVDALSKAEYSNNQLLLEGDSYSMESANGFLEIDRNSEQFPILEENKNAVIFGKDSVLLSDENGSSEIIPYLSNHSFESVDNVDELIDTINQLYTTQKGSLLVWTFTFVIYLFILAAFLFIVFIYAYLLYLMKDFTVSPILSYRESVNLILNLLGIPTMLALVYGFIRFNVLNMLAIQIISLIIILIVSFRQLRTSNK